MQRRGSLFGLILIWSAAILCLASGSAQAVKVDPLTQEAEQHSGAVQAPTVIPVSPVVPRNAAPTAALSSNQNAAPLAGSDLLIQSGDLLSINIYGVPEFSRDARVAERGEISLPLIGEVHVAGLTLHAAEALVQKRLVDGGFFTDPQVSIVARESASQGTPVLGEVQRPGIYYLPGKRLLFDALSAAGGTTARAGDKITITHRGEPTQVQTVVLPPNQTLPPEMNVAISPGDTIVVSKAGIVYVTGDVRLPGGFFMENANLTILQAIAMAQGANPTAKLDSTILIRTTPEGRQEVPIYLSKVMAAKAPDPKLRADDVIFVPRSNAKVGFRRGLDAALQTVVGMAIYRPL